MIKHIYISGRVQGVGFRYFTRKNAQTLNLNGWVKNLPDGRVELEIEGKESDVNDMVNRLKEGPRAAYVSDMEIEEIIPEEESGQKYTEFEVFR